MCQDVLIKQDVLLSGCPHLGVPLEMYYSDTLTMTPHPHPLFDHKWFAGIKEVKISNPQLCLAIAELWNLRKMSISQD